MDTKPKSRLAGLMLATLAGALALGGAAATVARAETGGTDAATLQAFKAAKLTLAEAVRAAEAAGQGQVTGAEFAIREGKPVYDVTTQKGEAETDHLIDPATGAMLASTPAARETAGDTTAKEASELTALQGARISLLQAVTAAEGQGGKALSAEYAQEDGALAITVEVADAAGKTVELKVDATTGQVMAAGTEAGESGETGESAEGQEG